MKKKQDELEENTIPTVEEVLNRYETMVYRLAYARTQNQEDAQDITQEVFLKYLRYQNEFHEEEHRKAWLLRVTSNTAKTLVTTAWKRKVASYDGWDEGTRIPEGMQQTDTFDAVETGGILEVVATLPEKYRIVLHLFYFEELSIKEVSRVLQQKESTVKSLLRRARGMLKERINREDYDV